MERFVGLLDSGMHQQMRAGKSACATLLSLRLLMDRLVPNASHAKEPAGRRRYGMAAPPDSVLVLFFVWPRSVKKRTNGRVGQASAIAPRVTVAQAEAYATWLRLVVGLRRLMGRRGLGPGHR